LHDFLLGSVVESASRLVEDDYISLSVEGSGYA